MSHNATKTKIGGQRGKKKKQEKTLNHSFLTSVADEKDKTRIQYSIL